MVEVYGVLASGRRVCQFSGIDFADYELDEPIQYVKSNAIQSATKVLQNNDWTRRKLLEQQSCRSPDVAARGSPDR